MTGNFVRGGDRPDKLSRFFSQGLATQPASLLERAGIAE